MFSVPQPMYVACPECGAAVPRDDFDAHECDRERWLDYQIVRLRPEIARLSDDFGAWLKTAAGRFEQFYAMRERHGSRPCSEG